MTPRYDAYLAALRPTAQLWRLVIGLPFVAGVYVLWMIGMGAVLWLVVGMGGMEAALGRIGNGSDPWSLILLLTTFLGGWLGVALALRLLHRGGGMRRLMGRPPAVLRDFALGVTLMAVIGGGLTLLALPLLPPLEWATPPNVWLAFLPLALAGILIQTGAEELLFRGYVQGHLAARFRAPLIWMGVPTVLFGLAHYAPGPDLGDAVWLVVAATGLFGLMASDVTARTGNLGLAWGLHFANNVLAILVISVMGGLNGLALLRLSDGGATGDTLRYLLLMDMALMTTVWIGCRLWLRRR